MSPEQIKRILEGALMATDEPLSIERMQKLFAEDQQSSVKELRGILNNLAQDYSGRAIELQEVASGYRFQVQDDLAPWISKLWEGRPPRYSRALMETLALIAYRQPITRAEIEEVRGVAVSTQIIKTLMEEREWIRVVGHRDLPGKPALLATTKQFLDYFNLKSLEQLPTLQQIKEIGEFDIETLGVAAEALTATIEPEQSTEIRD